MVRNKIKAIILTLIVMIFVMLPNNCHAYTYTYDYVIDDYKINMVVNEDNTFDITETITANFNVPKHGIYRKIPLRNSITRLDGTKSNNRAKISDISVSDKFTTSNENGYKVIKIGDANTTLTGKHTYTIKYKYNIGKDPVKNADELYFNLIGDEWDTTIDNVSFTITMPKSFDKSLLGFSSGFAGSTSSSNVSYNVNGNVITGNTIYGLEEGQALTVRLTLPENYFIGASINIDLFCIFVIILCLVFVLIADVLWTKYGKDEQVVETVEFYPPEGYNSAEVGFLYNGSADTKGVISLLIYLADKGFLKIEEIEEKALFSTSKGFKITKLKDYDGSNESERLFFDGLFKTKNSVTASDLYDKFYTTLDRIKKKINSKENKSKIFESSASGKGKYLILMIIAIFILITLKPIIDNGEIAMLPIALIFPRNWIYYNDRKSYRQNKNT